MRCGEGSDGVGKPWELAVPAAEGREQAEKYGCGMSMPEMNYGAGGKTENCEGEILMVDLKIRQYS